MHKNTSYFDVNIYISTHKNTSWFDVDEHLFSCFCRGDREDKFGRIYFARKIKKIKNIESKQALE